MRRPMTMSIWNTELLRLWRTRRLVALIGVFLFFGFLGPIFARYLQDILSSASNTSQMQIIVAAPQPVDGIVGYTSNALQIGLMVGIAIMVAACAIDANYALSVYYRTRHPRMVSLLIPRFAASLMATLVAFTLGLLAAWYETAALIGTVDLGGLWRVWLTGVLYISAFLSLAFLLTGVLRSVGVATTVAILLVLISSILTTWPSIARWPPVAFGDQKSIYMGDASLWRPALASLAISLVAVAVGVYRSQHRQLTRS